MAKKRQYNITLAGCGKMGGALLQSWLDHDLVGHVLVIDPLPASVPEDGRIKAAAEMPANLDGYDDILVIAVKPQVMTDIFGHKSGIISNRTVILSIAAGKTLTSLEKIFGAERGIVRSMPNTPAAIGKGMTVAVANARITPEQKVCASLLLESAGRLEWVDDETVMDAVTALSGSGPAYIFYLIESLAKAGEMLGLDKELSMTLARQTVVGSAALAEFESAKPPDELRRNVTSPQGTTQAALDVLMDGRFQSILNESLKAARKRSAELNS